MEVEANEIMISQRFPREKEGGIKKKSGLLFFHLAPGIPAPWILVSPAPCLSDQHSVQPCWASFVKVPPSVPGLHKTTRLKGALTLQVIFKEHLWDLENWILSLVNCTPEFEISKAVQQKHRLKPHWRSQFSFQIPHSPCSPFQSVNLPVRWAFLPRPSYGHGLVTFPQSQNWGCKCLTWAVPKVFS